VSIETAGSPRLNSTAVGVSFCAASVLFHVESPALSVIKDRIDNTKKYELEWFSNIHSPGIVGER
jgi:hypothetical protein